MVVVVTLRLFRARLSAALVFVLVCLGRARPSAAAESPLPAMPVESYRLDNGLTVALAPDPQLPDVAVVVEYYAGAADDPDGKEGLAHLVEHLTYKGAGRIDSRDYSAWIAQIGAFDLQGTTTQDATIYGITTPLEGLPNVLWLEATRMAFTGRAIDAAIVEREKRILANETNDLHSDQSLDYVRGFGANALFPPWHPYHRNRYGEDPSTRLARLTLADVQAFLRTWYSPANATLAVVGPFDREAVKALLDHDFGSLRGPAPPVRPQLADDWPVPIERVDGSAPHPDASVTFLWPAPAMGTKEDAALELAAMILAGPGGRLQHDLVSSGRATAASSRENSMRRASTFTITAALATVEDEGAVIAGIDRAVRGLADRITPEELAHAREELHESEQLVLERSWGRAARLAHGVPLVDAGKYDELQAEDVAQAVRQRLGKLRRVVEVVRHDARVVRRGVVLHVELRHP